MDYSYQEQRDFARMNIETQVTYLVKGGDGNAHHGISHDLSATGIAMTTDYPLNTDDEIEITLNPVGDTLPPFIADATVLRVTQNDKGSFNVSASIQVKPER